MSKVTKATLKSFLKKNSGNLYILEHSRFDGMIDCVSQTGQEAFIKTDDKYDAENKHSFGIDGVWVTQGRDSFSRTVVKTLEGTFEGIHCYNCCGSWTVAIKVK